MHARIHHLLSLRDGEPVPAGLADHVRDCIRCTRELEALRMRHAQLRDLETRTPPALEKARLDRGWDQLRTRLAAPREAPAPRPPERLLVAAAIVSWLVLGGFWLLVEGDGAAPRSPSPQTARMVVPSGELAGMVRQSQELDRLLRQLPQRPSVERSATALTIDALEGRIQWLDFVLTSGGERGLPSATSEQLWRERVELMDSLVQLRYVQAGRSAL